MISVLFVDNEHIVVDSLMAYFDRKGNPRLETQGAYSAKEALQKMEYMRIDVLVTDIRMPGMDGLQLQKEVNRRWPDCLTVFLSGHQSFDYMQEAMRNNCFDYVLKTEGAAKIYDTVLAAVEKLDERTSNARMAERAKALVERALPLLQQRVLTDMLEGSCARQPDLTQAEIGLESQSIWMILVYPDDWSQTGSGEYEAACHFARACVDGYLRSATVEMVQSAGRTVLLLSFHSVTDAERSVLYVQSAVENMQEQLLRQRGVSLSCCVSRAAYAWDEIPTHLHAMESQLSLSMGHHRNMLLTEHTEKGEAYVPGKLRTHLNQSAQLAVLMETGNQDAFDALLNRILTAPDGLTGPAQAALREEVFHTLAAILLRESNEWQMERSSDMMAQWRNNAPWAVVAQSIRQEAAHIFECKKRCAQGEDTAFVQRLDHIIAGNPGGDLSITRLGDQLGMNPYYMARLYKQLTGLNLKTRITQVRYEKACEMLRRGLGNREVAEAVGFHAEQSFNRFFKGISGQTPGEYRDGKKSSSKR